MQQWKSANFGNKLEAKEPSLKIQLDFVVAFKAAGQPLDMVVFSSYDATQDVVTAYFSPRASDLADLFGGTPCEKPELTDELLLLSGDQRGLKLLYPSAQSKD